MPTIIGFSTGASSTSSVSALAAQQNPSQLGAQVGDLIIVAAAQERSVLPSFQNITLNEIRSEDGGDSCILIGWERLTTADLTANISVSVASSTRRLMIGYGVFRDCLDPKWINDIRKSNGTGDFTAEHPDVTSTSNNTLLLSIMGAISNVAPYTRTFTSASGWTERIEAGSNSANVNPYVYMATKPVTNAANVAQTGNVVTDSQEKFIYYPTSLVIDHSSASAPLVVSAGSAQTVTSFSEITITPTISGGVAPYTNTTWTQTAGPTVTTTRSGNDISFVAPPSAAGATITFRLSVTDSEETVVNSSVNITVLAHKFVSRRGGAVVFYEKLTKKGNKLTSNSREINLG